MSERFWRWFVLGACLPLVLSGKPAFGADKLLWRPKAERVSADIKSGSLPRLLQQISSATGWQVFMEPGTVHPVSAKFQNVPPAEALRLLLGDLNFALVPETNSHAKLFVFRTSMQSATQLVRPTKVIPNELVLRLKPGAKIEDIARLVKGKVTGRIDSLNVYRLEFPDEDAAIAARAQLALNTDISSVDNNFSVDQPPPTSQVTAATIPPVQLQLKPPPADGRVIVGLVDTAVQPLGGNLDSFLLKPISVAGEAQLDPNMPSHGTTMAETMLRSLQAVTRGSTSVQILPVDVYGPNENTSTFDLANGIVAAVNGGARVLNLSLGSENDSPLLRSVIQDVSKQNIPVFAAAGNQPVTTPFYPAAYPEVMAVTAMDRGQIASYANRGSFISLGAPGTSVIYFNNQAYDVVGTSASSAFTSGIAAGYMDATHSGVDKMQSFIRNNFGLNPGPGN